MSPERVQKEEEEEKEEEQTSDTSATCGCSERNGHSKAHHLCFCLSHRSDIMGKESHTRARV